MLTVSFSSCSRALIVPDSAGHLMMVVDGGCPGIIRQTAVTTVTSAFWYGLELFSFLYKLTLGSLCVAVTKATEEENRI